MSRVVMSDGAAMVKWFEGEWRDRDAVSEHRLVMVSGEHPLGLPFCDGDCLNGYPDPVSSSNRLRNYGCVPV